MKNKDSILVCLACADSADSLMNAGKAIAQKNKFNLMAVTVMPTSFAEKNDNSNALEKIYGCVKKAKGEMAIYFNDDPIFTIAAHIGKVKPKMLIVGFPGENSNSFVSFIHLMFPALPISMIDGNKIYNILPFEQMSVVK